MAAKFFKDHQYQNVTAILDRLLSSGTPDKSVPLRDPGDCQYGWPLVSFQNELDFTALKCIVKKEHSLTDEYLVRAMSKMLAQGETSLADFEGRLSEVIASARRAEGKKSDLWTHVHPLHVTIDIRLNRPRVLSCFGTKFRIGKWSHLVRPVSLKAVGSLLAEYEVANASVQFGIEVQARGPSGEKSFEIIEPWFDALRGVIHLASVSGLIQYGGLLPRGRVHFLPWAIGWSSRSRAPEFFSLMGAAKDEAPLSPHHVTRDEFAKILGYAKKVRQPVSLKPIGEIIADSLRLYAQALAAPFEAQCFLGLWQMAEAMTLGEDYRGKGDLVCQRLLVLPESRWGQRMECRKEILDRLFLLRNEIAHRGIHHRVGSDHINILKSMCDELLEWLIDHANAIDNQVRLEQFFRVATQTTDARELSLVGFDLYFKELLGI